MGRRGFFATIFAALFFRPKASSFGPKLSIEQIGEGRTALIYAHIGESVPMLKEWCKSHGFVVQRTLLVNSFALFDVLKAKDCETVVCSPWMEATVMATLHEGPVYSDLTYTVGKMGRAAGHDWYVADLECKKAA
jgi:hypothetical protein